MRGNIEYRKVVQDPYGRRTPVYILLFSEAVPGQSLG